jgi:hypothetical protein
MPRYSTPLLAIALIVKRGEKVRVMFLSRKAVKIGRAASP